MCKNGHLHVAHEARRLLDLERILFVPAARPPHKPAADLSPVHHRLAMLRLAIEGLEGLEIDPIELGRPEVCYTIETLGILRDTRLCRPLFLLGADSLRQFESWYRWRELIDEFDLAVVDRDEERLAGDATLATEIVARLVPVAAGGTPGEVEPGRGGRIFRLPARPVSASSSEIRRQVRQGGDPSDLVPPAVARYIQRTGLYSQEDKR